jgi:hypothetical protein
MEQNKISSLLRTIRNLQLISLFAQCLLLLTSAYLVWKLTNLLAEKYLWTSLFLIWISAGMLLLYLFSRSIAWFASRNDRVNAAAVDRLYNLKERVVTYVELQKNHHPFLEPLVHETTPRLDCVSALRAAGIKSVTLLPVILLALLTASLWIVPYLPVPDAVIVKKQEQKRIAAGAKEMEEAIRRLEQKQKLNPETKKLFQEFKKIAQDLQKPQLDKAEALKKLNAIEEKLNKNLSQNQQKLGKELEKALQQAAQPEAKNGELSAGHKQELEQLSKDFKNALQGKEPSGGMDQHNLSTENMSSKDIQALKDALKKYQEQKSNAEQMRAEMQKAVDRAQKGMSTGKRPYITDSRIKDRDVEQGKGGVEDGPGTTNKDAGPSHFNTTKKGTGEYVEDRTKAGYDRLYEGERENVGKDPLYIESQWDENGEPKFTRVRNFGLDKDPALKNGSQQPSDQNQDESVIRKERVPPSYQEIVKKYFDTIEE